MLFFSLYVGIGIIIVMMRLFIHRYGHTEYPEHRKRSQNGAYGYPLSDVNPLII